ncbi:MAG TPA: hypothetical protein PLI95_29415, partial [Polyangiaceae bacterium]|nr:hypothetical protein [Polyangiaceae bacterium]
MIGPGSARGARRRAGWLGVIVLLLMIGADASAQSAGDSKVVAQALFDEALKLMKDGGFAQACPKLAESHKLDPPVGTLLYLGECYEHNGQFASAWATFLSAESAAQKSGHAEREKTARERAAILEPRVSRLMVVVPEEAAASGLQVTRNGVALGSAAWGVGIPVDPGEYTIEATAPGKKTWKRPVIVAANGSTLKVVVPALDGDGSAIAPQVPSAAQPDAPPRVVEASRTGSASGQRRVDSAEGSERGGVQRTLGTVTGILGATGLAVGAVMGVRAQAKDDQAMRDYCTRGTPTECDQAGLDLKEEAKNSAKLANIGFIAGGGLLFVGILLHATAPSARPRRTASP